MFEQRGGEREGNQKRGEIFRGAEDIDIDTIDTRKPAMLSHQLSPTHFPGGWTRTITKRTRTILLYYYYYYYSLDWTTAEQSRRKGPSMALSE